MIRRLVRDTAGAAAAEVVLIMPLGLLLCFTAIEAGHFMWCQHKAVEAVRNGVRYASRLPYTSVCPSASSTVLGNVATVTRTGALGGTTPLITGWDSNAKVAVTFDCSSSAFLSTGIYTTLGGSGATVTVSTSDLTYPALVANLGSISPSIELNASASTAVIGL